MSLDNLFLKENFDKKYLEYVKLRDIDEKKALEIRNELITANTGLIYKVLERLEITNSKYDKDDLFQEGFIGLMHAFELYSFKNNAKFSSYAVHWIRQKINVYMKNNKGHMRIPIYSQERYHRLNYYKSEYIQENGKNPSIEYLSEKLDSDKKVVEKLSNINFSEVTFEKMFQNNYTSKYEDILSDDDNNISNLENFLLYEQIKDYMSKNHSKEWFVINLRKDYTLSEVREIYERNYNKTVATETIRVIQKRGMKKIKEKFQY